MTNSAVKEASSHYQLSTVNSQFANEVKQVPVGYKQTEVGVIPEDWEVLHLDRLVAALESGVSVNSLDSLDGFPHGCHVLKTSCVSNGYFFASEAKSILPRDIKRAKCLARKGSIIVSRMNTPALVGELGFVPADVPNLFLPDRLWQMRLSQEKGTDAKWLAFLLSYPVYAQKIKEFATGTSGSMKNISKGSFLALHIPYPSTKEQTAIANALSDVDALIQELEKLIAKKQAIKTATMQQLLTGRTRLPPFALREDGTKKGTKQSELGEIPEDWVIKILSEISTMHGRIGWQGLKQEEFTFNDRQPFLITGMNFKDGSIRWDEVYHIAEDRYEMDKNIQLQVGDILMTKDGTIGKLLYVNHIPSPGKATLNSHLFVFRPKQNTYKPAFLYYLMKTEVLDKHIEINKSGSTFFGITQAAMSKLRVYMPSIEEQTAIATILSDMDEELQALEQRLSKTRQIKQGMMQELLTGKTRLIQRNESV